MLYEEYETDTSKTNLVTVAKNVPSPLCLLGGWAVFLTVNENFKKENGNDYHYSKDIDLGFYFKKDENDESIKNSLLNNTVESLKKIGFIPQNFRMVQHYHREQHRSLTEEESKGIPYYNIFDLYVDIMSNRLPENIKEILGFVPADEPILSQVFEEKKYKEIDFEGVKIIMPNPEVLLSSKINWVLSRTKDHKKIKDIADIYALIWYSGMESSDLRKKVDEIISPKKVEEVISAFTDQDYEDVSKAINIEKTKIETVIKSFIQKNVKKNMDSENEAELKTKAKEYGMSETKDAEKWRIPFNVGFESLKVIINSFYLRKADQTYVNVDEISKTSGLQKSALTSNILFFKSINVLEGDNKTGFKFTTLGAKYAKALSMNDSNNIKQLTLEIINESHLQHLYNFLKVHKDNLSIEKIYQYIKTEARIPDGTSTGNMAAPYATGARTLLMMLDFAGILPSEISSDLQSRKRYDSKIKSTSKKVSKKRLNKEEKPDEQTTLTLEEGILGKIMVEGVGYVDIKDEDTLEIAKSYLDILKKKLPKE